MPSPFALPDSSLTASRLVPSDAFQLLYDTFRANRVRFFFTALGIVVGTASLILVVTIALTGKEYVVNQIQSIGANMIDAEYQGGGEDPVPDRLTIDDMYSVVQRVFGLKAASPVLELDNRVPIGGGNERDVKVLGVLPAYSTVRNLVVLSGRFFDDQDEEAHNKVVVVYQKLAEQLYGSVQKASGNIIKLNDLPFTVIGTFKESVDTFGQSEVTDNTLLIPYSVGRYFTDGPYVEQIYFSASDPALVVPVTNEIRNVIRSRHRPESNYIIQNLSAVIEVANRTANALTLVLLLISTVTLFVSGIGIMNIMLATVNARTFEIGIRKAVGATTSAIRAQFLSEAVLISFSGGFFGILIGLALPVALRYLTRYRVPISGLSVVVALLVSGVLGIVFGSLPAFRAAKLDPVACLRQE
jgi:putative ABC transport system permease protein